MHPPLCLPASPAPHIFHSESHLKHISNNPSQNSHLLANCAEDLRTPHCAFLPERVQRCQELGLPAKAEGDGDPQHPPGSVLGSQLLPRGWWGRDAGWGCFSSLWPWVGLERVMAELGAGLAQDPPLQRDGQADGASRDAWSSLSYLLTPAWAGKQAGTLPVGWELRGGDKEGVGTPPGW